MSKLFGFFPESETPLNMLEYLDNAAFDEMAEIDLARDRCRNVHHVEGKYFVPLLDIAYSELFLYAREHMVHPEDRQIYTELMDPETMERRLREAEMPGILYSEFRYKLLDGGWRWVQQVLAGGGFYGLDSHTVRFYVFDIQYQKNRMAGLISSYPSGGDRDKLTGLLREQSFMRLGEELILSGGAEWCALSIDIENFKLFNDWYGRQAGDLLLAQIGALLKHEENHLGGLAGHRGQDDFALLIPYDKERIRRIYDEIHQLIQIRGASVGFLPAIGVCKLEKTDSLLDAMDEAVIAEHQVKGNFHTRIRLYLPAMRNQTEEEYRILTAFQQALKNRELFFCLQPQCRVSTGKVVGAESLARWEAPDGRLIPPDEFVPILEKYGFITDLDQYIWESVCEWLHKWITAGHTAVPISVNVSQIDIFTIDVPEFLDQLLRKYMLPREVLKIEITESAYVDDTAVVKETVQRLREKGFLVLMDDFGSGYSSLNMLRKLNVDVIKLDGQFLNLSDEDGRKGIHILETIVNMTKTMAVPIIVEGVESAEQVSFLENLGCRYIQGYHYYRPMMVSEFEKLVADEHNIDTQGFTFKSNQQFHIREFMDENIYSDSMLNNILGAAAFYCWDGKENVDIVRFNEQFYRLVNVPDFHDRLHAIQQFFHPADVKRFFEMFAAAERDRLNGAAGLFGVYRTDGSIGRFNMQVYYLEEQEGGKIFYGAMQEVTQITDLQNKMRLLSAYSSSSTVFLRKQPDGSRFFEVIIHGLRDVMGLTVEEFQQELNDGSFYTRLPAEVRETLMRNALKSEQEHNGFGSGFTMRNALGREVELYMKTDYVNDDYSDVEFIISMRKKEL